MKELCLGTIGSGSIVHTILDQVNVTDGIRLTAVYSRMEEKGKQLAAEYGAGRVYTDLDAFLADEEINTVYIASPNLLHYEQTRKALLAGKHVICEKPFCTKADQARELTALAKEKRLFLADAVPTAFLPNLEVLKRELPKVGKVRLVLGNYSQYTINHLLGLDAVLLEANHDVRMLETGPYPYYLKRRIMGNSGHLSNDCAGRLLGEILHDGFQKAILGHLSKENNYADLAYETVRLEITEGENAYRGTDFDIVVADRKEMSETVYI